MKTYILEQPGRLALADTPPPARPGSGEVLVRVLTVGICGTDLHAYEGTQPFFNYPRILGHELGVEVIETGEGVTGLQPGDRCAVNPYVACGECAACRSGRTNCCAKLRVIGVHSDGGMRDRIVLPAKQMYVCRNLTPAQIPLVETLAVGCHAVGRAEARPEDRAMVIGAGPIGLSVLEFLRLAGAEAGVVELLPERLEFAARRYGLRRAYASHQEALQEAPCTLVFDCTGDKASMEAAIQLLEQGGKLVFVGIINDCFSIFDPDIHRREATILASRNSTSAEHRKVLELMESGGVNVSDWPTDYVKPEDMPRRFPLWVHRQAGVVKAVVGWA